MLPCHSLLLSFFVFALKAGISMPLFPPSKFKHVPSSSTLNPKGLFIRPYPTRTYSNMPSCRQ